MVVPPPFSALLLPQRLHHAVSEVLPAAPPGGSGVDLRGPRVERHGLVYGAQSLALEVVEGVRVEEGAVVAETLLEQLAPVAELDDRLGVGVERGDRRRHAAGERAPRHAGDTGPPR